MNIPLPLDRTASYCSAESRDSRSPWVSKPPNSFVTISRETGSGGSSLARLLAQKLNAGTTPDASLWSVYGGNLVEQMLQSNRLPDRLARFLPEDRVAEISASIGELVGLHPSLWELVQKTNETTRQLAKVGHVVLVGRGANFAAADIPGGIHVRLVAPLEYRVKYFAQSRKISEAAAAAHIAKSDAARRRYVAAYFNADVGNPAAYDMVINTALVPLAEAAELLAAHVQTHAHVAA